MIHCYALVLEVWGGTYCFQSAHLPVHLSVHKLYPCLWLSVWTSVHIFVCIFFGQSLSIGAWCFTETFICLFQVMKHSTMCLETSQTWPPIILRNWNGTNRCRITPTIYLLWLTINLCTVSTLSLCLMVEIL